MRIAIVADVHGNLTAFEAVVTDIGRRAPDLVVQGGDLALMGPRPAQVIDRVRELGWPGVVGNTDELLWRPEGHERQRERAPQLAPLLSLLFGPFAADTSERLGEERIEWLKALPTEHREGELCLVHARPGDLWRAPRCQRQPTTSCTPRTTNCRRARSCSATSTGSSRGPWVA
jgi:Icc-related predicted phosphoesterase